MKNIFKRYIKDTSGQFAVMTAIFAVPLVLCLGIAIDTTIIHRDNAGLQTALDSAALASVIPGNLGDEERSAYAKEVFGENYPESANVELVVQATPNRVDIQGTVVKETLFMGINGANKLKQRNKSAAIKTTEEIICLMTLNKTSRGSLNIEKNAQVYAPNCSIQVNSTNQNALISAGNYKPQAQKICVHGGVNGNLGPNVQANCSYVEDPYAHLEAPNFTGNDACDYGPMNFFNLDSFAEVISIGARGKTLTPGVYCNGLHLYDSEVNFEPGTYIIHDGPLSIGNGSIATGDGVTFVFTGENSFFYTYDEVSVNFSASRSGPYAGLIFMQDRDSSRDETSIIKGSANIQLVGTTYFPTQDLFVGGLGNMGANSPAMAFIADNITLTSDIDQIISENEGQFQYFKAGIEMLASSAIAYGQVQTDYVFEGSSATGGADPGTKQQDFITTILTSLGSHSDAGLPPVLPRSDGGARLVSVDNSPL